ncbi:MAG: hypothetical protein J7L15_04700 [Clostridiales bacterium]|nr:hypothetical protein [Clostridiales bacterium]
MKNYSTFLTEAKVDKGLVKAIEKDMIQYGGPLGQHALENYITKKINDELESAMKAYFKTSHGSGMIDTFISDAGIDLDSPQAAGEREYYEDDFTYQVRISVEPKD